MVSSANLIPGFVVRLRRNRLFFIANEEWLVEQQNSQSVCPVSTAAIFGGDFSALGSALQDPTTKAQFTGNIIPPSSISPISKALLNYYNSSTLPGLTNNWV